MMEISFGVGEIGRSNIIIIIIITTTVETTLAVAHIIIATATVILMVNSTFAPSPSTCPFLIPFPLHFSVHPLQYTQ